MEQQSVDDYTETILFTWYTSAALWMPPVGALSRPCALCAASELAEVIDPGGWPHDLIHKLASGISEAVDHVAVSLAETDQAARGAAANTQARAMVLETLGAHRAELVDVLDQCITDRLGQILALSR